MPAPKEGRWLLLMLVASALLWLFAWYGDTVQTMIATWNSSETYAHGYVVAPISAWLIWRNRRALSAVDPHPNFWMLIPLAFVGFIWLLANLATVAVVQQYALVLMIVFMVATILGNALVRTLAFPLLFLLFAVPFGEVLLPALMAHTADFTVFALKLTGIPVYREGLYFMIPSGSWSVIEACSGLRYLVASVTLGVLYAYLTYTTLRRRILFILLSIAVPVIANWLRAYMIVMIGHLTSMKHAVGVDHLIYGWVFFGLVMLLLYWVGSFWREDSPSVVQTQSVTANDNMLTVSRWKSILAATVAASGMMTLAPAIASHLQGAARTVPLLHLPRSVGNWQTVAGSLTGLRPQYMNPSAHLSQSYEGRNARVELFVSYYRNQRPGAQLISSKNALVHTTDKSWAILGSGERQVEVDGEKMRVLESRLKSGDTQILAWHWYWIDGHYTSNAYWAKLLQARSMLSGRGDDAAVMVAVAPYRLTPTEGIDGLDNFVKSMLPGLTSVLRSTR